MFVNPHHYKNRIKLEIKPVPQAELYKQWLFDYLTLLLFNFSTIFEIYFEISCRFYTPFIRIPMELNADVELDQQ